MSHIFPNRLTDFPLKTKEVFVMGIKSRKKKFYLFRKTKGKNKSYTDFEIYVRFLLKRYDENDFKKFEFFTKKEMYKALQNGRYRDYEDFPYEYFSITWEQVRPKEEDL